MTETLTTFIAWIADNYIYLLALLVIITNRKSLWKYFVRDPLTGGNGHTQPDELAKWLLMVSFIAMLATYSHVKWPMQLFAMVLLSVVAIAKLDTAVEVLGKVISGALEKFNKPKPADNEH